jgi:hypothetical protein
MSSELNESEKDALEYLYSGGEETIECHRAVWVKTRYTQKCCGLLHKGPMGQSAGTVMVRETAKVDGQFGSCYTCKDCLRKTQEELKRH